MKKEKKRPKQPAKARNSANALHKHPDVIAPEENVNQPIEPDESQEAETKKRKRLVPARLPYKLRRIRSHFGLSQIEMLNIVRPDEDDINRARISQYENGRRTPTLIETYLYAKYAGVPVETLILDEMDLPF